jgi:hypothetical protein
VQFELDLSQPVGYVGVIDAFDVDRPGVRVLRVYVRGAICGVDELGYRAVDCKDW